MRKFIFVLLTILILSATFFLYPRKVNQGVVASCTSNSISIFIDGNLKTFKTSSIYPKFTVVSFNYNYVKAFSFNVIAPIKERIMMKTNTSLDLESSGSVPFSSQPTYYQIDQNNSIKPVDSNKLIVGKDGVQAFKDSTGKLQTILLFPVNTNTMRVAISTTNFQSIYHSAVEVFLPSGGSLSSIRDHYAVSLPNSAKITLVPTSGGIKFTFNGIEKDLKNRIYIKGIGIVASNISRGKPVFNPSYNGVLEFMNQNSRILVINEVDMEDYLTKVVPSEMPTTGGIEALKSQAIAARTYAISDMLSNRFSSLGFYVDDSTQSQVYNNVPQKALINQAIAATKGLIMTYNGTPIDAKYYSTSAGTGAAYEDIWFRGDGSSEKKPYLQRNNYLLPAAALPSTEDGWLSYFKNTRLNSLDGNVPYFRWKLDFPSAALSKSLNTSIKSIFPKLKDYISIKKNGLFINSPIDFINLKDIIVDKRGPSGNITELSFIFENATLTLKGDYTIRTAIRCDTTSTGIPIKIIRFTGDPVINIDFFPSSFFAFEKVKGKYMFYGGGYGHGVGMSQNAALSLSRKGMSYKDILNTFYKDVKIEFLTSTS